ncbi:MAG: histidinol-phosphate transaminase [Thaumarchaeota archaeon]|nr:histidinol-phosphate transaminase [Nitrososphaerota archaeon]
MGRRASDSSASPSSSPRSSSRSSSRSSPKHPRAGPKTRLLADRLDAISRVGGYQKPEMLSGALKLDSNENYTVPKQFQIDAIIAARRNADVREYPLGGTERLVAALSRFTKMPASMIAVGNGSDQILDMLLAHVAGGGPAAAAAGAKEGKSGRGGVRILTSDPTFGFFEDRCRLYGMQVDGVPFSDDMTLDASAFLERAQGADVLYLDSPNNPTGFQFAKSDLQRIISKFDGLVIIDEAYGEFGRYTVSGMARRHPNLAVVRTLSKSFGLAGLRLGYMIADRRLAGAFTDVVQYPYPLSTISIEAGLEALRRSDQIRETAKAVKSERARIIEALKKHDAFDVFGSDANFVLFDVKGAYKRVHAALAEQGISVRRLGRVAGRQGCLRVTVGTREMNSRFLIAIRDLLG